MIFCREPRLRWSLARPEEDWASLPQAWKILSRSSENCKKTIEIKDFPGSKVFLRLLKFSKPFDSHMFPLISFISQGPATTAKDFAKDYLKNLSSLAGDCK